MVDSEYPGTAVERMMAVRERVAQLAQDPSNPLNGPWEEVRRKILWAGGLKDLPTAIPGQVREWPWLATQCQTTSARVLLQQHIVSSKIFRVTQAIPSMTTITST